MFHMRTNKVPNLLYKWFFIALSEMKYDVLPDRDREAGNNSALEWWLEDQTIAVLETLAVDTGYRFSFHLVMSFYNTINHNIIIEFNKNIRYNNNICRYNSVIINNCPRLNFTANVGLGKWSLVGMLDVFFIGDGRNLHPSGRDWK